MCRVQASKRPESKRPSVQSPSVQSPGVQSPSVQTSGVQASKRPCVQSLSVQVSKRLQSKRPGVQSPNVQSSSAQSPGVQTMRPESRFSGMPCSTAFFFNYFKHSMKRKNSSKMNTAMASGAVERRAQENIGCTQHSTTVLSVTYFLY